MKMLEWVRFTWDLDDLPTEPVRPESRFRIRLAERGERANTILLIKRAFAMDSDWLDGQIQAFQWIDPQLTKAFEQKQVPCLLLCDGQRAVGASLLDMSEDADSHLLTGPCISSEYRNRKLGTLLFDASLRHLKEAGLRHANAIAKKRCTATRYLYPRYGAQVREYEIAKAEA